MAARFSKAVFLLVPVLLYGCSAFTSYRDRIEGPLEKFESGDFKGAYEDLEKRARKGTARLPYLLEAATVLHAEGDLKESNRVFSASEDLIRSYEERAVISVTDTAAKGASLVLNEKTIPYEGEPFEKVLVHSYKALNYLFLGQTEAARVEIRRSFARQQENRRRHEREIAALEEEVRGRQIQTAGLLREAHAQYDELRTESGPVLNPYEDPFAYYLSALVYEFNGEYNDAYIDLKRAQELRPGVPCVENDLLRMAKLAGLDDAYREWSERLGRPARFSNPQAEGEILVFLQAGMGPRKEEVRLVLPVPEAGLVSLALPRYARVRSRFGRAALYDSDGRLLGETAVLTDIETLAIRNLEDRMPVLVLKQVLRAAAKGFLAATAADEGGAAAALAVNLFNLVTEQADLRCWTTLPRDLQVARIPVSRGSRRLTFAFLDPSGRRLVERSLEADMAPGSLVYLNVRTGSRSVVAFHVYGAGVRAEGGSTP